MQSGLRERLNKEVTRGEFLRYAGVTLLLALGLGNVLSLLGASKPSHSSPSPAGQDDLDGFGTRKFGV